MTGQASPSGEPAAEPEASATEAAAPLGWSEPSDWPTDAERDALIGDWHIYQRRGGHRTSTDDVLTAWYAVHRRPHSPERYLDLGCGVGSVLLMVCHKLEPKMALGLEAQPQSVLMARRAAVELPAHPTALEIHQADFRHFDFGAQRFELITASPPYFPLHTGVLPHDAQRRACRFEARGGVESYVGAVVRALSDEGFCYLVFQTAGIGRVVEATRHHGLHLTGQADFWMRSDRREPFLSVFELARRPVVAPHRFTCAIRDENGDITDAYAQLRAELRGA